MITFSKLLPVAALSAFVASCPCPCSSTSLALAQGCCTPPSRSSGQAQKPGGSRTTPRKSAAATSKTMVLRVEGMTCGGCALGLRKALQGVAGVREASVDFATGLATVHSEPAVTEATLLEVVTKAGFKAKRVNLARTYLHVAAMTCEACAAKVKDSLSKLEGASDIAVDLKRGRASATVESARLKSKALIEAVEAAGFKATVIPTEQVCLRVLGMTCDGCVRGVSNSLSKVDGIEGVDVDLKTGITCVTRQRGKAPSETLVEAVNTAGGSRHGFSAKILDTQIKEHLR